MRYNTAYAANGIRGEPTPSEADIKITRDLIRAGQRIKIEVLDHIIVGNPNHTSFGDEAHSFKNLFYLTKMTRIAGLPQTASERAFDMFLKVRHVQSLNGGGGVVFATGTPIANSMAEMFTMQRYLQPNELKKHNLDHFDAWAATFGEPVTAMELPPDGAGYRLNTRFARFINVPELMQMFRQAADVQTAAMLDLPRPKLDGEKPAIRNAPATPELKKFVQELAARADKLKTGRVDPSQDNMLKITSEGRKAALDLRLMKPTARDEPQVKVNQAVENIHRIWQATIAERSAQMVFVRPLDAKRPRVLRLSRHGREARTPWRAERRHCVHPRLRLGPGEAGVVS